MPLWIKTVKQLKAIAEKLAKQQFATTKDAADPQFHAPGMQAPQGSGPGSSRMQRRLPHALGR
jgi:hypothetical protein